MIYVKYKLLTDTAMVPTKGSKFAAGFDLYADITEKVCIHPGECVELFSGIAFEIPDGYVGLVFSRSGISTRQGLCLANGVGVIDSDYRGNVGIPIRNHSSEEQVVMPHERIAQMMIIKNPDIVLYKTAMLSDTERGSGGFGSTGRR